MPLMTVTIRATIGMSNLRHDRIVYGDIKEFDTLLEDLKMRLQADNVVIDDIEDTVPGVLRLHRI